jgi:hypothetical protein
MSDFDVGIFWVGHMGIKVEVLEVNGAEASPFPRQNTVEKELGKFKRPCVGAAVTWVAYAIATNGDAGAIRIVFLGSNFAYHQGVTYFFSFVGWYVLIVDENRGVSAPYTLGAGGITRAKALAERTEFIGVQGIPEGGFVVRVALELVMYKKFTIGRV